MSDATNEDMGIRGEATGADLLAAVKLALAAKPLGGVTQTLNLIDWIVELHEPAPERTTGTRLFIEAIRETRV